MAKMNVIEPALNQPAYGSCESVELSVLHECAERCRACPLWEHATQVVFGEGPATAKIVMIGEQPGDKEDLAGKPFIGPAGQLLDRCLDEAGVDRSLVYVTNAVKHFKWVQSGTRRLHQKPNRREVMACHPWLEAELRLIDPEVIVCLGATASQSILGPSFRLTQHRGELLESGYRAKIIATLHPSALLRMPDAKARDEARQSFVDDLRKVARLM